MNTTKVLVVSGKGGVGKTTVACATAVAAADRGLRTLAVSLDRAHSLGDVLGMPLCSQVTKVSNCPNLEALEINPQTEWVDSAQILREYMERFFQYLGAKGAAAQEMAVFPGLEELLVLSRLAELAESGAYDLIVTDMAPTASSIRYLSFPDMMEGVLGKLVTWDQRFATLMRPFQGKHLQVPVPEKEVYSSLRQLADRLHRLKDLLQNPLRTRVRLVMVPESVVLEETRRALAYFSLFGLAVDAVIVNRIFPSAVNQGYFESWRKVHTRILTQAAEALPGLHLLTLEFQADEVTGLERLRQSAGELYKTEDPVVFYQAQSPLAYTREGDVTVLALYLPNVQGKKLNLRQRDSELIITVDEWRRALLLPDFLQGQQVAKAKLTDGWLKIRFTAAEHQSHKT